MNIVRAERVDFQIAPGISIEFYRFPDGEKRIGITSAATVCGLNKSYLTQLGSRSPNQLEALQSKGFDGWSRPGSIERGSVGSKGAARIETLSQSDFLAFIRFAAFTLNKRPAMAIAEGLMGIALETIARQAFGEEALTLNEIREALCKEYAKTIDWAEEDKEDSQALLDHQIFLSQY